MASRSAALVPVEHLIQSILILRAQRVILDSDLAAIYGVTTARLNEAVKRNAERLPEDFMFRLSAAEQAGRGGRRKLPWAFTEHGAIQAANVLNSPRAIARSAPRRGSPRSPRRAPPRSIRRGVDPAGRGVKGCRDAGYR